MIAAVTGITASDKVYDATTSATLDTTAAAFTGRIGNDSLVVADARGAFADADAARGKPVGITGLTLGGADAGNYTLADPTALATASITPRGLVVSAQDGTKVYGNADPAWAYRIAGQGLAGNDTAAAIFNGNLARNRGRERGRQPLCHRAGHAGGDWQLRDHQLHARPVSRSRRAR